MTSSRILAYRGVLDPILKAPSGTLSRSRKNGNYYIEREGQEAVLIGSIDAEKFLQQASEWFTQTAGNEPKRQAVQS